MRTIITITGLFWLTNATGQYAPSDFAVKPMPIVALNDGYQNINPFVTLDGSRLFCTKIGHPSNTGKRGGQDVWFVAHNGQHWLEASNNLPGINTETNDLVVGRSVSGNLYVIHHSVGGDRELRQIRAYKNVGDRYVLDHEFTIPNLRILSEFVGFFVDPDEKFVLISMKSDESFGKEDLYVVLKKESGWSAPIHLGARVNSGGFEMSPFMANDGRHLFFASDGHGGFGSSDIFVTYRQDESWQNWSKPINLGPMVNSAGFEAYFSLNEVRSEALFVTNRTEQMGSIYAVSYAKSNNTEQFSHLAASGFIKMEKLPAMNIKLELLDENDRIVQTLVTNEDGYFNLQSFLPDRDYKIAIDESIRGQIGEANIFLTNELGQNMVYMNQPELGMFGFKVLSGKRVEEVESLENMAQRGKIVDKPSRISGKIDTYGTLKEKVQLKVVDENDKVLETITTDEKGYFSFTTKAVEKSYFLTVDESLTGLVDVYEIYLTNDNPGEDIVVSKTDKHLFEFRTLSSGSSEQLNFIAESDAQIPQETLKKYGYYPAKNLGELSGYLKHGKLPMMNTEILLVDENDKTLDRATTDMNGMFMFDDRIKEGNYSLKLNPDQESELKNSEIYLARNPDDVLFYLNDNRTGVFAFKKLAHNHPITLYSLRTEAEQGAIVSHVEASIKGKFAYSKLPKTGVTLKLVDEAENVIQVTEVHENGDFEFKNYLVNKNYFIAVDGAEGLSDIYEVYISGQNKNVLVNNTDKFVFAFKVLPTQDVVLSYAYEKEGKEWSDDASSKRQRIDTEKPLGDSPFFELDLDRLKSDNYSALKMVVERLDKIHEPQILRLYRASDNGSRVELKSLSQKELDEVLSALEGFGVNPVRIAARFNASDQYIITISPQ